MTRTRARLAAALVLGLALGMGGRAHAQAKPHVVEYYYQVKWGSFDEFFRLFKKNHHPVLMKEKALGRILGVEAERPRLHSTEDGRWDLRVTITWRDAATANDDFDTGPLIAELFPDRAAYDREEQRRFELLLAHWDLPVRAAPLDK